MIKKWYSFNESKSESDIINDLKDILLDLSDVGYKIVIGKIEFISIYNGNYSGRFIDDENQYDLLYNCLERIKEYSKKIGFKSSSKNTLYKKIMSNDYKKFRNTSSDDKRTFRLIINLEKI